MKKNFAGEVKLPPRQEVINPLIKKGLNKLMDGALGKMKKWISKKGEEFVYDSTFYSKFKTNNGYIVITDKNKDSVFRKIISLQGFNDVLPKLYIDMLNTQDLFKNPILSELKKIEAVNIEKVEYFDNFFAYTPNLKIPSGFSLKEAEGMSSIMMNTKLKRVDFKDETSFVKDFTNCFRNSKTIEIKGLNFRSADRIDSLFRDCESLTSIDEIKDFEEALKNKSKKEILSIFEGTKNLDKKTIHWLSNIKGIKNNYSEDFFDNLEIEESSGYTEGFYKEFELQNKKIILNQENKKEVFNKIANSLFVKKKQKEIIVLPRFYIDGTDGSNLFCFSDDEDLKKIFSKVNMIEEIDSSLVENFDNMFKDSKIRKVPQSMNFTNAKSMESTFENSLLETFKNTETTMVKNFKSCFERCEILQTLEIDILNATSLNDFVKDTPNLRNIKILNLDRHIKGEETNIVKIESLLNDFFVKNFPNIKRTKENNGSYRDMALELGIIKGRNKANPSNNEHDKDDYEDNEGEKKKNKEAIIELINKTMELGISNEELRKKIENFEKAKKRQQN